MLKRARLVPKRPMQRETAKVCSVKGMIVGNVVVHAAPFNFYCIFALLLCGLLGCGVIPHYGPMKKAEKRALEEVLRDMRKTPL